MPPPSQLHLIDRVTRDGLVGPLPPVSQLVTGNTSFAWLDESGYILLKLTVGNCPMHVELIEAVTDDDRYPRIRSVHPDYQDRIEQYLEPFENDDPELLEWAGRTWVVVCVPWSR